MERQPIPRQPPSPNQSDLHPTPEETQAPLWFQQVVRKVTDAWFDPKSFETPGLYEKLGIRTFKKYLPTSGDLIYRLVWKKFGSPSLITHGDSIDKLQNWSFYTKVYEVIHLAAFSGFSAMIGAKLSTGDIKGAVVETALNTLVNVYPIMLQRYNRLRLYRTIQRMERRQPPAST